MTAFEDFVNLELPRRPVMLTVANTGYDADPNAGGAPDTLKLAPIGSFYLQETPVTIYQKLTPGATGWVNVGGGAGGFLPGSVLFADPGGDLTEDNANFFWNDSLDLLRIIGSISAKGAGSNSEQVGLDAQAGGSESVAVGHLASSTQPNSIAVGTGASATGFDAIAVGNAAGASVAGVVVVGQGAIGSGSDGVAVGRITSVGFRSVAIGWNANSGSARSVAIGPSANTVAFDDAIALGSGALASANNDGQWGAASVPIDFQSYRQLALGRAGVAVNTDTVTSPQAIIGVTDTSVARTVTLQTATLTAGRVVIVKDESGLAGTNNITVATQGAETIDGAATVVISTNYGVVRLYSNGTNWFIF